MRQAGRNAITMTLLDQRKRAANRVLTRWKRSRSKRENAVISLQGLLRPAYCCALSVALHQNRIVPVAADPAISATPRTAASPRTAHSAALSHCIDNSQSTTICESETTNVAISSSQFSVAVPMPKKTIKRSQLTALFERPSWIRYHQLDPHYVPSASDSHLQV